MTKKTPGVGFYGKVRIPTIGHKAAIDQAKQIASQSGGALHIALSGTAHPLTASQKTTHAKALFQHPVETNHSNVIEFLQNMHKHHDDFTLVCGSDRANEYRQVLNRYNGKYTKDGKILFNFKKWQVHEIAGKRKDVAKDPSRMSADELVQSVSATKLEKLARDNKFEHFKAYHPGMSEKHVKRIFDQIRRGAQLKEQCTPQIGLTLSRDLMPQLPKKAIKGFLNHVRKNGATATQKKVDTTELKSSQSEFDINKVFDIAMSKDKKDPIVVSGDDHILDGHHRWIADHGKKIDAYVIDLPILELLRQAKEYTGNLKEEYDNWQDAYRAFVEFAEGFLKISNPPDIDFESCEGSFGGYIPGQDIIKVSKSNRHPMDVFRTIAHELVHHKQYEDGRIKDATSAGKTGSDIENEANAVAGQILRNWAKQNPSHFNFGAITENIATFVVGGPCSGKDQVIRQLKEELFIPEIDIQHLLKTKIAEGVTIVNGSADRLQEIKDAKTLLEHNNYYTSLVFVDTTNEISKLRNEHRVSKGQRMIAENIRFQKFTEAQKNKDELIKLFKENMTVKNNVNETTKFDTRIGKGNKPSDREWGKASAVRIYQNDTPGQSPEDIAKWALKDGEKVLAKEETKIKVKKKKTDVTKDVLGSPYPDTDNNIGVGPTVGTSVKPFGLAESIVKWMNNPKTISRFNKKYGALAEEKMRFAAQKLNESVKNKTIVNKPKSLSKIRESIDAGMYDMGTVPSTGQEQRGEQLPADGKIVVKPRKKLNK